MRPGRVSGSFPFSCQSSTPVCHLTCLRPDGDLGVARPNPFKAAFGARTAEMAFVIWMTGLPCSGKTTIVRELQKSVPNLAMLDGDELREWLSPKDFTKAGRDEHNVKVAHLARLLHGHGVPVAVSLVSPYIENRSRARDIVNAGDAFAEVYVKCALERCEERDVKGMYKKARSGEIATFTGVSDPYEEPPSPDITVDTQSEGVAESARKISEFLASRKLA